MVERDVLLITEKGKVQSGPPPPVPSEEFEPCHRVAEWWRGPSWLLQNENAWPAPNARESYTYDDTALEKKKEQTVTHVSTLDSEIFDKYSSFTKLTSIVAWCLRFKHNVFNKSDKLIGPLTVKEFNLATARLVKIA
ncbi:hypothetical protein QE152_g34802 [Popillia japonica]|uniref:Uncharacterized protein n=1 Tax=Popillia japonica TaxID=7064 RepID=A0AAW1IU27_POPJA